MKYPFLSTLLFFFSLSVFSQSVTITPSGITPTLPATYPRIAYDEILALPNPALGDMAYDITFRCLRVYNGTKWLCTYQTQEEITPNITAITSAGGCRI
ncbi:MAG: hypothetical protein R2822_12195 [Spirosomataceae bacterium]